MKNIIYLLLFVFITSCTDAKWPNESFIKKYNYQEMNMASSTLTEVGESNGEKPDKFPMYPNGLNGVLELMKKYKYPVEARRNNIGGQLVVQYVVEKDGSVGDVKVVKSADPLLDAEAVRLIKSMERWVPGYKDGKPVRVRFYQPFNLALK